MLIFTLMSIIILLSVVLLMNTNQSYQKGYVLKKEQLEKDSLELEERGLINKIIGAQVYNKIENNPIIKQMVKADNPIYIKSQKNE